MICLTSTDTDTVKYRIETLDSPLIITHGSLNALGDIDAFILNLSQVIQRKLIKQIELDVSEACKKAKPLGKIELSPAEISSSPTALAQFAIAQLEAMPQYSRYRFELIIHHDQNTVAIKVRRDWGTEYILLTCTTYSLAGKNCTLLNTELVNTENVATTCIRLIERLLP